MSAPVKRILIIAVPGFGDVLLYTPMIRAAHLRWPDAELDVMVRGAAGEVLEGNADVDQIIVMQSRAGIRDVSRLLLPRLRKYDLVVSNAVSDRTTFYSLLLGRRRVSMVPSKGKRWQRRLSHAHVEVDEQHWHIMERTRLLGEAAGIDVGHQILNPVSPDSSEVIAGYLGAGWQHRPYAVIHPSASLPDKRWHKAGWQAVIEHLRRSGLRVVVTGGPGDEERRYLVDGLGLEDGRVTCLIGCLRLCDIGELLANAKLYVGVDTLVSHMAAAVATPVVVLFGPTNPVKWAPWPFRHEAEVSPYDGKASQRVGNVHLVCDTSGSLDQLTEAEVLGAIDTMLEDS